MLTEKSSFFSAAAAMFALAVRARDALVLCGPLIFQHGRALDIGHLAELVNVQVGLQPTPAFSRSRSAAPSLVQLLARPQAVEGMEPQICFARRLEFHG